MPATGPTPYLTLPGTARAALTFYRDVFGGELALHSFGDFGRQDGPPDTVAHGTLDGPVTVYACDAAGDEPSFSASGLLLSLLGTAEPAVLQRWFAALGDGGEVLDPLAERAWGAWDGQVRDRYGVAWLIGWEPPQP